MYKSYTKSVLDKVSASILKSMKGQRLYKVGYVDNYIFSLRTILVLENHFVEAINDVFVYQNEIYTDEVNRLAFRDIEAPIEDIAYETDENGVVWLVHDLSKGVPKNPGKYMYKEYNKIIRDITLVHDHYDFIDRDIDVHYVGDEYQVVVLHFEDDSNLLIATGSSLGESLDIYDDISILDGRLSYMELQGIDPNDEERILKILDNRREIIPIDEYDPDEYTVE